MQQTASTGQSPGFELVRSCDLDDEELIGTGGFGKVYHAHHIDWGEVAVKKVLETEVTARQLEGLKKEARKLSSISHANIVRLIGVVMETNEYALVMDYMSHGSLFDFVCDHEVPFPLQVHMIYHIILGVNYLHTRNPAILHLDLKGQNVLVNEDFNIKLCDFGLSQWRSCSKLYSKKSETSNAGTVTHVPPEKWQDINCRPNVKFDVYAFGIVVWEILAKEEPYANANIVALIRECVSRGQRPDMKKIQVPKSEDWLKNIIIDSWSQDPNKRPTFSDLKGRLDPIMQSYRSQIPAAKRQLSEHCEVKAGNEWEKEKLRKEIGDLKRQLDEHKKYCKELHEQRIKELTHQNYALRQEEQCIHMNYNVKIKDLMKSLCRKEQLLNEATLRLDAGASSAVKAGNVQTEDMSTPFRLGALAKCYEGLYSCLWPTAFDELNTMHKTEEYVTEVILVNVLVVSFRIAQNFAKMQRSAIENMLVNLSNLSFVPCQGEIFQKKLRNYAEADEIMKRKSSHPMIDTALDYVKFKQCSLAVDDLGALHETFAKEFPKQFVSKKIHTMDSSMGQACGLTETEITKLLHRKTMRAFTERCIEIAWFMNVQTPPMYIEYLRCGPVPFDKNVHKVFGGKGAFAIQCIWPTLYYSEGGDVAVKGSYYLGEIDTPV